MVSTTALVAILLCASEYTHAFTPSTLATTTKAKPLNAFGDDNLGTQYSNPTSNNNNRRNGRAPFTSDSYSSSFNSLARQGTQPNGIQSSNNKNIKDSSTTSENRRSGDVWDDVASNIVQGESLLTYSFQNPNVERVQLRLDTQGRELDADIELWQGPNNIPVHMRVYVEDGSPFTAVIETPGCPNTVAVRNTASLTFPLRARVLPDEGGASAADRPNPVYGPREIQGGSLSTFPFDYDVDRVQVLMETDGRPLSARIELMQGPNNNKQVVEVYTDDGNYRPFFIVLETPGPANAVRVVNTATMEFPLAAWVEPFFGNTSEERSRSLGRRQGQEYGGNRYQSSSGNNWHESRMQDNSRGGYTSRQYSQDPAFGRQSNRGGNMMSRGSFGGNDPWNEDRGNYGSRGYSSNRDYNNNGGGRGRQDYYNDNNGRRSGGSTLYEVPRGNNMSNGQRSSFNNRQGGAGFRSDSMNNSMNSNLDRRNNNNGSYSNDSRSSGSSTLYQVPQRGSRNSYDRRSNDNNSNYNNNSYNNNNRRQLGSSESQYGFNDRLNSDSSRRVNDGAFSRVSTFGGNNNGNDRRQ